MSVARSDTSFICFELSVDYISAVWLCSVLAGTDWKVGVALWRWNEREEQWEEGVFLSPPSEMSPHSVSLNTHTEMRKFVHIRTQCKQMWAHREGRVFNSLMPLH